MAKEMLINVSAGEECRIALLDGGKLEELYMERASATSHVGNIYKGRVTNVEPSIQAAFVDFGLGRNGFLHISDLQPSYFGRKGEDFTESVGRKISRRDRPPIQRCLRRGDEITVQIIKEGIGTKGPTLSTYLSIPGRILVMMPGMSKFGISKKIEDEEERRRLRTILDSLKLPVDDVGFIVRTAGVGKTKAEIDRDLKYLLRLWDNLHKKSKEDAPVELYTEGDLVTRTVRDVFTNDVESIICDDKETAKKIKEFFKIAMPRTKNKVELYDEPAPLFHKYKIEPEIEKMYSRHVPLPSGGSLVIDQTEAIVAIDVNSGKFREHNDAETTAFRTDMEAADEIPRQLRLRDLGGVIICDFIDLRFERHRRELEKKLHDNLKKDRAKTKVLRMSQFGIIEMTRQRMRPSLKRSIYQDCPHCKGAGLVKTAESMSLDVMRRLALALNNEKVARVELTVGQEVAFYLLNRKRAQLTEIEDESGKHILVKAEALMALDELKLELFDQRDGMVYLSELGVLPPSQLKQKHPPRQDRGQGRHQRRRDSEEERLGREDLDSENGAAAAEQPAPGEKAHDAEPGDEDESRVIELDDAHEGLGEAPRGMDEDDRRNRRGRRDRRGRDNRQDRRDSRDSHEDEPRQQRQPQDRQKQDRPPQDRQKQDRPPQGRQKQDNRDSGRGRRGQGGSRNAPQQNRPSDQPKLQPFRKEMGTDSQGLLPDPDAPEPGNELEAVATEGNGKKKRRRRGGRRHRERRERAAARAAAAGQVDGISPTETEPFDDDLDVPSEAPMDQAPPETDLVSDEAPAEESAPRRVPPQRIPPQQRETPPVVKTGTADKHLADDEPVEPVRAPRRPKSRYDLDAIPDDFD